MSLVLFRFRLTLAALTIMAVGDSHRLLAQADERRPNIVIILADDLGWRDLSCYGSTFYETPHIDRLAQQGLTFRHAYSSSPLCSPTRASMLTGMYPSRHGITTPAGHLPQAILRPSLPPRAAPSRRCLIPKTATRLRPEFVTYAEVLKEVGYRTAFMGKWHLGKKPYLPEQQGFDIVVGGRGFPGPPGGYFAPWPIDTLPAAPPGTHIDDVVTKEAIRFIKDSAEKRQPFLLNLWYYSVHAPFEAKPHLIEKYRHKAQRHPTDPQASPVMAAMIETLDTNVGRVMGAIQELGIQRETIVLFTSDNGGNEYNFAGGVQVTENAPLRNGKGNIHEGGHRVPMMAVWPGRIAAGTQCRDVVTSVDFFPTIIELAKANRPSGQPCDGISLLALLERGESLPAGRAVFTFFPHETPATGSRPAVAVRRGRWVAIRFVADGPRHEDRVALYDILSDMRQQYDLSQQHPEIAGQLNDLIEEHIRSTGAVMAQPNPRWSASADGWVGNDQARLTLHRTAGTLVFEATGNDSFMRASVRVPAGRVTVQMRVRWQGEKHDGRWYYGGQRDGFARERSVKVDLESDGEWHTKEISFDTSRPIERVRFDPASSRGRCELDWLRIISWRDAESGRVVKHWDF